MELITWLFYQNREDGLIVFTWNFSKFREKSTVLCENTERRLSNMKSRLLSFVALLLAVNSSILLSKIASSNTDLMIIPADL